MTKITAFDLTPFYRNAIGVDRLFDRIVNQIDHASRDNYPPYNILETGENSYQVQVAVAGFGQGDVQVSVQDGDLVITGEHTDTALPEGHVLRHQGISARRFVRTFNLADHVEVKSAEVRDGILIVNLEREIPDSAKPKTISVTYSS